MLDVDWRNKISSDLRSDTRCLIWPVSDHPVALQTHLLDDDNDDDDDEHPDDHSTHDGARADALLHPHLLVDRDDRDDPVSPCLRCRSTRHRVSPARLSKDVSVAALASPPVHVPRSRSDSPSPPRRV